MISVAGRRAKSPLSSRDRVRGTQLRFLMPAGSVTDPAFVESAAYRSDLPPRLRIPSPGAPRFPAYRLSTDPSSALHQFANRRGLSIIRAKLIRWARAGYGLGLWTAPPSATLWDYGLRRHRRRSPKQRCGRRTPKRTARSERGIAPTDVPGCLRCDDSSAPGTAGIAGISSP